MRRETDTTSIGVMSDVPGSAPAPTAVRPLSALLRDICEDIGGVKEVSIATLLEALHERGFGVLLIMFAAPAAIPAPPGINTIFAIPLLLLTVQQAMGRHTIWMPRRVKERKISTEKLCALIEKTIPWIEKLERFVKPRMEWVTWKGPSQLFGFLGVLMAAIACIPLPLTHTVPSLGIILMAVGTIMRDGLSTVAGAVIGTTWITVLAAAVLIFGPEVLEVLHRILP